jgi:rhodanese-related sulfurtransferase
MNLGFANPFRQSSPPVKALTAKDAIEMVASGDVTLIDVRDHNEVANTGKAQGALHIPLFQLSQQADPRHPEFHPELKTDKPVALYCASGARSQMAVRTLSGFGFAEVHNIGGFMHWQAAGGASTR